MKQSDFLNHKIWQLLWQLLFIVSYPIMLLFSLFFTIILWVFSNISRLFRAVFALLESKKGTP